MIVVNRVSRVYARVYIWMGAYCFYLRLASLLKRDSWMQAGESCFGVAFLLDLDLIAS